MKQILVIGLFLSEKNKTKIARTAADQLAQLLLENGYPVIKTSVHLSRLRRFVDTIWTIFAERKKYSIAIVPLYGGFKSYIWEISSTKLLRWLGKKVVLIIHGGSIPDRLKKSPQKYIYAISTANIVVCPSNYIASTLKSYNLNSQIIENVLPIQKYHFHCKKSFAPKLLWMRTFEDVYNPLMAVKVLYKLKKIYFNATMIMAGYDRGMLEQTIALSKELNIFEDIKFPGYINDEQKKQYTKECDFFICTNQIDNAPVTLIEMMLMGIPVITVDSGGIPFIVTNNNNGILVKYNDDEAMVNCIKQIIDNPTIGINITQNAYKYAQAYGEKPVLEKWTKVFNSLEYNN